ncbi:MAG: TonB-dependent receptor [Halieaceae bacterium]|jgi:TonB-dependent receptor
MYKPSFRKTPIAAGLSIALGSLGAAHAGAQESVDPEKMVIEEVFVVGIRGGLQNSMDRKRDSQGVVDAITAEDIGKFPDTNLAESLQRITGVSIDRSNGEGSKITVRGMGPEFNLVTLNGRTMPTAGSRSFDFNDISTEGVSAVEVYKTSNATLPSGGIGATVNMQTRRPLDKPGLFSVLSVKAVHETSSPNGELDEVTPEIAGFFSNTFMDDKFGISISGAYQERQNREENAAVDSWIQDRPISDSAMVTNNNQRADGVFWSPQNAGQGWGDITRERINGQVAMQFEPNDRITATLDYTYSELDFEKNANSYGVWFDAGGALQSMTIDERGSVTDVTEVGGDYATNITREHTIKENKSLGFNVEWQATDTLSFNFDVHDSTSELSGGGLGSLPGTSATVIVGNTFCDWCGTVPGAGPSTATLATKSAAYGSNGVPIWDFTVANAGSGAPQDEILPIDMGSLFALASDSQQKNEITQFQLKGLWENQSGGAIQSIEFGYAKTDQKFNTDDFESPQLPAGFWLTSAVHWDDNIWQRESNSLLSEFSNGGSFPVDYYYTGDFDAIVDGFETVGANDCCIANLYWPGWPSDFQDTENGRGRLFPGPRTGASIVEEEIDALFAQINFEDDFNGMTMRGRAGVRYEDSTVKSQGLETPATAVVWIGGNEWIYEFADDRQFSDGSGDTKEWLPSLDLSLEVREGVIVRGSYSRSLARPPIGDLNSTSNFQGTPKVDSRDVSTGNPGLLPYISDNFDLSLEYYYGAGSYVSLGYFKKRVSNFLQGTTVPGTFDNLLDPYFGPRALQAREELAAEGIEATNTAVFQRINLNQGVDLTTPIRAEAGDPPVVFDVSTTENGEEGNLRGWEFAVQHMFGESGFGVLFNATLVGGDVDADRDAVGGQFALEGLSDSANFSAFYENNRLSARIAYNWRDEFLSGFDAASSPVFAEEYQQIDGNVTYYFNDKLAFFVEALNITEEVQRSFVRYDNQFLRGNQYGARYNLGARYTF